LSNRPANKALRALLAGPGRRPSNGWDAADYLDLPDGHSCRRLFERPGDRPFCPCLCSRAGRPRESHQCTGCRERERPLMEQTCPGLRLGNGPIKKQHGSGNIGSEQQQFRTTHHFSGLRRSSSGRRDRVVILRDLWNARTSGGQLRLWLPGSPASKGLAEGRRERASGGQSGGKDAANREGWPPMATAETGWATDPP